MSAAMNFGDARIQERFWRHCNAGIGQFRECLFALSSAVQYLSKHNGMPRSGVELEEGDIGYGDHNHS